MSKTPLIVCTTEPDTAVDAQAVKTLPSMQPNNAMQYVSSTALGVACGAGAGVVFGKLMGRNGNNLINAAVDSGITVGLIAAFERVAEDSKIRDIKRELDAKFGHQPERH